MQLYNLVIIKMQSSQKKFEEHRVIIFLRSAVKVIRIEKYLKTTKIIC